VYQRNTHSVPKFLRNWWLGLILGFSLVHLIFASIGASTSNLYWFGVDSIILVVEEVLMTTVLNTCICKLARYLKDLTQEKGTLGATGSNFEAAVRKMWWVRIGSILLTIFAASFQIASPGATLDRMAKPYTPIIYDNAKFNPVTIVTGLLACGLHSLLLYMLRRPQPKSERASQKTTTIETSSTSTPPRPSRSSRPSTLIPHTSPKSIPMEAPVVDGVPVASNDVPVIVPIADGTPVANDDIPVVIA